LRQIGGAAVKSRMKFRPLPSQETVRRNLHYDPLSGLFVWLVQTRGWDRRGSPAGTISRGYVKIGIEGQQYPAARLAWVYVYGAIPEGMEIDHKDGNPSNNRLSNLRLATSSQQKQNKKVQSNNKSGLKGAYYHAIHKGKKWRTQIKVGDRLIFLGYFHRPEEAHAAYRAAEQKFFGEFARRLTDPELADEIAYIRRTLEGT